MEIQLVVFDLAGTTVKDNKEVHLALQKAFDLEGIFLSMEEANEVMGIPKPVAIKKILLEKLEDEFTMQTVETIHNNFLREINHYYETSHLVVENDGVSETFKLLKENNIKVAVDTGFGRETANVLIERLGWLKEALIDAVVTSDEVENGRPFPDMIFRAMELTGVEDVAKVAKVGDTPYDLIEGTSAGCGLVVGITSGAYEEEDLMGPKHQVFIREIPQILTLLGIRNTILVQ